MAPQLHIALLISTPIANGDDDEGCGGGCGHSWLVSGANGTWVLWWREGNGAKLISWCDTIHPRTPPIKSLTYFYILPISHRHDWSSSTSSLLNLLTRREGWVMRGIRQQPPLSAQQPHNCTNVYTVAHILSQCSAVQYNNHTIDNFAQIHAWWKICNLHYEKSFVQEQN